MKQHSILLLTSIFCFVALSNGQNNEKLQRLVSTPSSATIDERETSQLVMSTVLCEGTSTGSTAACTCTETVSPAGGPFSIRAVGVDGDTYEVYYAGSGLDYDVATSYSVTLDCYETADPSRTASDTITISVIEDITDQLTTVTPNSSPATVSETSVAAEGLIDLVCYNSLGTELDCTCSVSSTNPTGGPFDAQQNVGDTYDRVYYTGAGLDYDVASSYSIVVTCIGDLDPSTSATTTVTVNVVENIADKLTAVTPDATQNPSSISEWTTTKTGLTDLICTNPFGDKLACTCTVTGTSPTGGPFEAEQNTGDTYPRVYYTGGGLSYSTASSYTVGVTCTGVLDTSTTATTTVTVNVIENKAPIFPDYPSVTADSLTATTAAVGDTVYTATATDPDGSSVTYKLSQSPDLGYFTINPGTGEITLTSSLQTATDSSVTLTVEACDIRTCSTKDLTVTVPIIDLNSRPSIDNLPETITVPETVSGGYLLETLTITDANGQDVDTSCSVSPSDESYKFVYETNTKRLKLATLSAGQTLLDYDSGTTQYKITCIADDGYLQSENDVLTINVQNVNEAPVFPKTMYYCTLTESDAGVSQCTLGLSATDPDGDTITYSLMSGNNSQRFDYVSATDSLTFAIDYEIDNGAYPQSTIITIQAVDTKGLTGTSQITVTVEDANDNTCEFTSEVLTSTIDQGTSLGFLGTFAASDADLTSPNNDVTFETVGGDTNYLFLFSNGQVQYSQQIPESEHGRTFFLTLRCVDGGNPARSATATYALSYLTTTTTSTTTTTTPSTTTTTTTPTTTTTTQKSDDIWDEDAFVAVFAILMTLLGLALIGLLTWLFCCGGCGGCAMPNCQCQNGCQSGDCCQPYERQREPLRVKPRPRDDFFRTEQPRANSNYRDFAWGNGDSFEDGSWGGGRASSLPVTPSGIRALPY